MAVGGGYGGGFSSGRRAKMMSSPMAAGGIAPGRRSSERLQAMLPAEPVPVPPPKPGGAAGVKVRIKVEQVKGPLAPKAVKEALEAEIAKLTACCQDTLKTGIKLPAAVTLTFQIGSGGKVSGPVLPKLPLGYEALTKCLSKAVQDIAFPDPGTKTVAVTVKLVLEVK